MISANEISDEEADVFVMEALPTELCPSFDDVQDSLSLMQLNGPTETCCVCWSYSHKNNHNKHVSALSVNIYDKVTKRLEQLFQQSESPFACRKMPPPNESPAATPSPKSQMTLRSSVVPQPAEYRSDCDKVNVKSPSSVQNAVQVEETLFATSQSVGILDLGASQTVMGQHQVSEFLQTLPEDVRSRVFEQAVQMSFRFGNNSTVPCEKALLVPVDRFWIKIAIVPSKTPFLISNNVCRSLGAIIDTEQRTVFFRQLNCTLPLTLSGKKLFLLDFSDLTACRPPDQKALDPEKAPESVLTCVNEIKDESVTVEHVSDKSKITFKGSQVSQSSMEPAVNRSTACPNVSLEPSVSVCVVAKKTQEEANCPAVSPSTSVLCPSNVIQHPCRSHGRCDQQEGIRQAVRPAQSDEPCPAAETDYQVWPVQSWSDIPAGGDRRSEVLPVVSPQVPRQSQGQPCGVCALPQAVGGTPGVGDGSTDVARRDCVSAAEGQECPTHACALGGSDRSGGRGGRGDLGCHRDPDQWLHGPAQCPAPRSPGEHSDGSAWPAACPDSAAVSAGHRQLTDPAESFMIERCIQETNLHLQHLGKPAELSAYVQTLCKGDNWVYQEMQDYFRKHSAQRCHASRLDVLEVFCSKDSQLTKQCIRQGMTAQRFGLADGDLSTVDGRYKLYDQLLKFKPKNIWASPKCRAWCKWSQFNAARSTEAARKIMCAREQDEVFLLLCVALFQHQCTTGSEYHFHLEQPVGSDMLLHEIMALLMDNAHVARCDQCHAGKLTHPENGLPIQKGTQVVTTSNIMARYISSFLCTKDHAHAPVAGSITVQSQRMALSQYTELYTATFGQRLARSMKASKQVHEKSVAHPDLVLAVEHEVLPADLPDAKRRRLNGKSPSSAYLVPPDADHSIAASNPESGQLPENRSDVAENLKALLHDAQTVAPRVGKLVLHNGPLFDAIQKACPEHVVRVVELCKGTDRQRKPPIRLARGEAPWRCSIGLARHDLSPLEWTPWCNWEVLSNRQLCQPTPPSRLRMTIFARQLEETPEHDKTPAKREASEAIENESKRFRSQEPGQDDQLSESNVEPTQDKQDKSMCGDLSGDNGDKGSTFIHDVSQSICQHGPKFMSLDVKTRHWISKIHHNLGHPNWRKLHDVLKMQGYDDAFLRGLEDFQCSTCHEFQKPKVARPATLSDPREFNDCVGSDLITWTSKDGNNFQFIHFVDAATGFQVAMPVFRTDANSLFESFQDAWCLWAGPCRQLVIDNASPLCSDQFAQCCQEKDIHLRVVATYAHWQLGKTERHGDIIQHMLQKYESDHNIQTPEQFKEALQHCCQAKNSLSRAKGYTPEILVLGKMSHLPASVVEDPFQASHHLANSDSPEGVEFRQQLLRRESARLAFVQADHSEKLRRAFLRRQRPHRGHFQSGTFVMFWRPGKGEYTGQWHGPGRVIIQESEHVIWVSHSSRLYRVAPEHVRKLSEREASNNLEQLSSDQLSLPQRVLGKGVFQFEDLTDQVVPTPPHMPGAPSSSMMMPDPLPEVLPVNPPNTHIDNSTSESEQPDAEPVNPIPSHENSEYTPTTPLNDLSENEQFPPRETNPVEVPIPPSDDEGLVVEDFWVQQHGKLLRVHQRPRQHAFDPSEVSDCPADLLTLHGCRSTTGTFQDSSLWNKTDFWGHDDDHWQTPEPWTGVTMFTILDTANEVCSDLEDVLHLEENQGLECSVFFTEDDLTELQSAPDSFVTLAAAAAKRQRVEVKMKDLNAQQVQEFQQAKDKEIDQWIATETVKSILRHKIPEKNILRCRWVLTWKDLDPIDAAKEGKDKKAKARLVILGYEDPDLTDIPRDSPTLQKETRALILQLCASRKHVIRSFDIKTAFLRGSRRDNRLLGIDPPDEMRRKLNLGQHEICELLKSAYGLVNAPYLWYQELKETLLNLGFQMSPLDPCLFVLTDASTGFVHGAIGMHVDDGLCFGDSTFDKALAQLESRFPFGSKRERDFLFTGIHIYQDEFYNIHLSQSEYTLGIDPIHVDRHRRKNETETVTETERQSLRGVIGSLQYAATNSRPDLSAKLSFLQSRINCATIADLLDANRLLGEAKKYSDTTITISSIPEEKVRIVAYSDASFASRAKQQSQKGGLFLAVHEDIFHQKSAMASPLVWYSKKIERVVASTLAAETFALSSAVDLTHWLRLAWEWLRQPNIPWQTPEEVWKHAAPSIAVMDCKSLYDVITKNTTPQCQEHRTLIEALVIKDNTKHGIRPHWVHSAAQLADSLTKAMDNFRLREFLRLRTCCLHDVDEILKQRSDRKALKNWLSSTVSKPTTASSDGPIFGA